MTDKLKVDLLLEKHGLPSSLERNLDELPFYAPADETERRQMQRGKPYIGLDHEWHTGQDYRDQSEVPLALAGIRKRWPDWVHEAMGWFGASILLALPFAIFGIGLMWIIRHVWAWMVRP